MGEEDQKFEFDNDGSENLNEVGVGNAPPADDQPPADDDLYESSMEAKEAAEPAGPRANRRETRKDAHYPGPRRPPKFEAQVREGAAEDGAQSEAEPSDSAESSAATEPPKPRTEGEFEKPMTFGHGEQ